VFFLPLHRPLRRSAFGERGLEVEITFTVAFTSSIVPGGSDGPSGVLVCCENYLVYKNFGDQPDLRCPIPRRKHDLDDAERSMLFVCSATHRTKVRVDCW